MITNVYKWHRKLALIACIPILGWCVSGLTHPIMARWLKIKPAHRFLKTAPIQVDSNTIALDSVLKTHQIDSFRQVRPLHFQQQQYYQITQKDGTKIYINTQNNQVLEGGDEQYAVYLARHFSGDAKSKVNAIKLVRGFTRYYKFINRLLPVYKVSFDRADGVEVYVETSTSRLGTINNNARKICITIFSYLHNWSFLDGVPLLKRLLMILWMLIAFLAGISGLVAYGFRWKQSVAVRGTSVRRWHRRIGLTVALSILAFAFSGAYHVVGKIQITSKPKHSIPLFSQKSTEAWSTLLEQLKDKRIANISLIDLNGEAYYQVAEAGKKAKWHYFHTVDLKPLNGGVEEYATMLAIKHSNLDKEMIQDIEWIYSFEGEYGFINKRLPVIRIRFNTPSKDAVYVELSTGKLAAHITNAKRLEAFSFLMLHKYHFLDFLGKDFRDLVLVFILLLIVVVHLLGGWMWWKKC